MKRTGTRGNKWLWATLLLLGLLAVGITIVPRSARRVLGWPQTLMTTPDTEIRSMALSRNGEMLAAAGSIQTERGWKRGSGTVYLWDARTGKQITTFAPVYTRDTIGPLRGSLNGWDIYALTLSPDAKQIGFSRVGQDYWELYDAATQKPLWRFPQSGDDAEYSPDGRFVALSVNAHVYIINASDGQVRTQWERGDYPNSSDVAWSPDEAWVADIGPYKADDPLELHRADDGRLVRRIQRPHTLSQGSQEITASVAFAPDSRRLVVAASVGSYSSTDNLSLFTPVRCYDALTGTLLWEDKTPVFGGTDGSHASFCDAVFSPDGRVVAAYQFNEGKVWLLDSGTGRLERTLSVGPAARSHFFVPPGLVFSPDGRRLFARGGNAVLFWDLK